MSSVLLSNKCGKRSTTSLQINMNKTTLNVASTLETIEEKFNMAYNIVDESVVYCKKQLLTHHCSNTKIKRRSFALEFFNWVRVECKCCARKTCTEWVVWSNANQIMFFISWNSTHFFPLHVHSFMCRLRYIYFFVNKFILQVKLNWKWYKTENCLFIRFNFVMYIAVGSFTCHWCLHLN